MGAHFAKSKIVHSFDELSKDGAQALIDNSVTLKITNSGVEKFTNFGKFMHQE